MRFLILVMCFLAVTSCGGGEAVSERPPVVTPPVDPVDPVYETIFSTASVTSGLTAAGFVLPAGGTDAVNIQVPQVTGTVTHDAGPLVLDDGNYLFNGSYVLNDPNDPNGGGYFADGTGATYALSEFDGGGFDYLLSYVGTYQVLGVDYVAAGVSGIATETAYVPTSGSATYSGSALGAGASSAGAFELADGDMTVNINFETGNVSLTADGFTDTGAPVDTILVTGATLSDNLISGGTVNLRLAGATANGILGPNRVSSVEGGLFGWDPVNDVPDEVGGVILQAGDNGYVNVYFATD